MQGALVNPLKYEEIIGWFKPHKVVDSGIGDYVLPGSLVRGQRQVRHDVKFLFEQVVLQLRALHGHRVFCFENSVQKSHFAETQVEFCCY